MQADAIVSILMRNESVSNRARRRVALTVVTSPFRATRIGVCIVARSKGEYSDDGAGDASDCVVVNANGDGFGDGDSDGDGVGEIDGDGVVQACTDVDGDATCSHHESGNFRRRPG